MIAIKVPPVGESITEVTLTKWVKKSGDVVRRDEVIAELESEKATFDLNAEQAGRLITKVEEGATLNVGDLVGEIDETATAAAPSAPIASAPITPTPAPSAPPRDVYTSHTTPAAGVQSLAAALRATPLASKMMETEHVSNVTSENNQKINKEDVLRAMGQNTANVNVASTPAPSTAPVAEVAGNRSERVEKLSNLRRVISRRLVASKNTTAMLTTFNEVDMTEIMRMRSQYKDAFKKKHDVNLGFMSFFVRACTIALGEWQAVNAYITEDSAIYHDYVDVSIAVSSPRGLVVPVIRNTEKMSMADIEKEVVSLATKARESKLTIEEMTGGTFTITNGGVFGSLMSTPIINLPQSAILGMHKIQERPMAIAGKVEIHPMMYVALSYDHRIIDGRESVGFLVRVKELLENPNLLYTIKNPTKELLDL